ncbi:MAG: hypothetical protein GF330_03300 [Candidatus Eisenbacteria bacterium]|nr:hypothetical protein [Candidatus Eisenbacteria bacterium]
MRATPPRTRQSGSALLIAVLVLGAMSVVGTALILTSVTERHTSSYFKGSLQALGAAETGLAFAKRAIQDMSATMGDYDSDGRPDFGQGDTLSWGGAYDFVAEASDIQGIGIAAYRSNGFAIVSEGRYQSAVRRVKALMVHDSFLKYARFIAAAGTGYACGALLTGEVYAGGNLNLAGGCGADQIRFLEFVATVGDVINANEAIFERGYVSDADPIDLENSVDFSELRDQAQGTGAECDCEGIGEVGIYFSLPGTDPLGIGSNPLDLSQFDFYDTDLMPGDTVVTFNGAAVTNTTNGGMLTASDFNGIIFFEGDARVEGTMDGRSGRSLSVYATDDVIIYDSIYTGHTGFDPGTGAPSGSGNPVNLGLIANDYVFLHRNTPRVLQVDAALMACHSNWRVEGGGVSDHPSSAPGPLDLDCDGIVGETPYNNDPDPGAGWDELNITSQTWVLNINGPIITYNGGSAWPWNDGTVLSNADGPTRRYNYDMDVVDFPPPCFPVPLNLWKDVSWTEVFETENELTDYLPD